MPAAPTIQGSVSIDINKCKGCELCIPACPAGVLRMTPEFNAKGYHYVELFDGCTGCEMCYLICPDYVFEVYRRPQERKRSTRHSA